MKSSADFIGVVVQLVVLLNINGISCDKFITASSNQKVAKCCGANEVLKFHRCIPRNISGSLSSNMTSPWSRDFDFAVYNLSCEYWLFKLPRRFWHLSKTSNKLDVASSNYIDLCVESKNDFATKNDIDVFLCTRISYKRTLLELILKVTSCIFFGVTIAIYSMPFLRKRHGRCTICYLSSLGCAMGLNCISFTTYFTNVLKERVVLIIIGYCTIYFFYVLFNWLNVIIYDVHEAIRKISIPDKESNRNIDCQQNNENCALNGNPANNDTTKFRNYCIFAYVVPIVVMIILAIIDNVGKVPRQYRPNITAKFWWFGEFITPSDGDRFAVRSYGEIIYFISFASVSLITGFILLICTTVNYRRIIKMEEAKFGNANNSDFSILKSYKDQLVLNWKLYVSMVIPNIARGAEIIMDFFNFVPFQSEKFYKINHIFFMFYACTGILIFIHLVLFRPKLWNQLFSKSRSQM